MIFLMMEGGPSHVDTFDPKPALDRLHLREFVSDDRKKSAIGGGRRSYVRSPFRFVRQQRKNLELLMRLDTARAVGHPAHRRARGPGRGMRASCA